MTKLLLVVPTPIDGVSRTIAVFQDQGGGQPTPQPQDGRAARRDEPGVVTPPGDSKVQDPKQAQGGSPYAGCYEQAPLLLGMLAIFYFLLIRPAQKQERKRRELVNALKRGDRIVMNSGIHGEILSLDAQTVTVKVDRDVKLVFDRTTVGRVLGDDNAAATPTKTDEAK